GRRRREDEAEGEAPADPEGPEDRARSREEAHRRREPPREREARRARREGVEGRGRAEEAPRRVRRRRAQVERGAARATGGGVEDHGRGALVLSGREPMWHLPGELRVLVLVGSLRADSYNRKLADLAARLAAECGATVDRAGIGDFDVPLYDGDVEVAAGIP